MIMVFALLMTMFYIPINIAFYTDDYAVHWKVMNLMLDCIFLMDIVLNFRTGFVDSATDEVITIKQIFSSYSVINTEYYDYNFLYFLFTVVFCNEVWNNKYE